MNNSILCGLVLLAILGLASCSGAPGIPSATDVPTGQPPATNVPPTPAPRATVPSANPPVALVVQSNKPRAVPAESRPDEAQVAEGNNAFAFDLYQKLRGQPGNLFYSPYSISLALAMTYAGAHGATESQMAQTLHFSLDQDRLHPAFNSLDHTLASRGQGAQGTDGQGFRLKVANALWGEQDYKFLPPFLDLLAENYGAGLRLLDMKNAPDPSRVVINQWVSDQTEGKIKDLIPAGGITPDSRLVLTNAIYFNVAWAEQFKPEQTQDGPFTLANNTPVTAPMMRQTTSFGYAKENGYQAVELPYDGQQLSMLIILPDAGKFDTVEAALNSKQIGAILDAEQMQQVSLTMPKWKIEDGFSVTDVLKALGMRDAFAVGAADFSGMDGTRDLYISDVLHKAFVAVDEQGTEAAAATATIMTTMAMPSEPITLTLDHPFIFLIRDRDTGTILFVGRVADPR